MDHLNKKIKITIVYSAIVIIALSAFNYMTKIAIEESKKNKIKENIATTNTVPQSAKNSAQAHSELNSSEAGSVKLSIANAVDANAQVVDGNKQSSNIQANVSSANVSSSTNPSGPHLASSIEFSKEVSAGCLDILNFSASGFNLCQLSAKPVLVHMAQSCESAQKLGSWASKYAYHLVLIKPDQLSCNFGSGNLSLIISATGSFEQNIFTQTLAQESKKSFSDIKPGGSFIINKNKVVFLSPELLKLEQDMELLVKVNAN